MGHIAVDPVNESVFMCIESFMRPDSQSVPVYIIFVTYIDRELAMREP